MTNVYIYIGFCASVLESFLCEIVFVCSTEKELNTKCVVEMVKNQTVLHPASMNLGKGDSRYAFTLLFIYSHKHIATAETPCLIIESLLHAYKLT